MTTTEKIHQNKVMEKRINLVMYHLDDLIQLRLIQMIKEEEFGGSPVRKRKENTRCKVTFW